MRAFEDKGVGRIFCGFSDVGIGTAPDEGVVDGDADPSSAKVASVRQMQGRYGMRLVPATRVYRTTLRDLR